MLRYRRLDTVLRQTGPTPPSRYFREVCRKLALGATHRSEGPRAVFDHVTGDRPDAPIERTPPRADPGPKHRQLPRGDCKGCACVPTTQPTLDRAVPDSSAPPRDECRDRPASSGFAPPTVSTPRSRIPLSGLFVPSLPISQTGALEEADGRPTAEFRGCHCIQGMDHGFLSGF